MAIQIVMDRTGDSRHHFNSHDAQEIAKAEQRFYELTKVGFTAAVRTGPGQVCQIRSFDPNAEDRYAPIERGRSRALTRAEFEAAQQREHGAAGGAGTPDHEPGATPGQG